MPLLLHVTPYGFPEPSAQTQVYESSLQEEISIVCFSAVSYEAYARVLRWLRDPRVLQRPRYDPHLQ